MDSVQSYFKFNLATLDTDVRHRLFPEDKPVYTKVRDELPARYMDDAWVLNSMVADGCIINGMVEHSVLFRGVKIDKGAHVKTASSCRTATSRKACSWKTAFSTSRPSSSMTAGSSARAPTPS